MSNKSVCHILLSFLLINRRRRQRVAWMSTSMPLRSFSWFSHALWRRLMLSPSSPLFFAMSRLHIITDAIVALAFALFTSASVRSAVAASLVVPPTQASTAERFCF